MNTINATSFQEKLKTSEQLNIIDLRTFAEWQSEHINDCIHLPVQDLNAGTFQEVLAKIQGEKTLYLLCQSGRRAHMAVEKLKNHDGVQLIIIEGGLNALKEVGTSTITPNESRKVISLERQVRIAIGLMVLCGLALGIFVNTYFLAIPIFAGAGLVFAGLTDQCALGMLIARMPWNSAR